MLTMAHWAQKEEEASILYKGGFIIFDCNYSLMLKLGDKKAHENYIQHIVERLILTK